MSLEDNMSVDIGNIVVVLAHERKIVGFDAKAGDLESNSQIFLAAYSKKSPFVCISYGDDYLIEIGPTDSVSKLKAKIRQLLGIPVARQKLTRKVDGVVLQDRASIAQAKVLGEFVVLTLVPESGWTIDVIVGDEIVKVPIEGGNQPLSDVKWFVGQKTGLKPKDFQLIIPSRRFEEDELSKSLWELGIFEKSSLYVTTNVVDGIEVVLGLDGGDVRVVVPRENGFVKLQELVRYLGWERRKDSRLFADGSFLSPSENCQLTEGTKVLVI
jgi:hypothetical protein